MPSTSYTNSQMLKLLGGAAQIVHISSTPISCVVYACIEEKQRKKKETEVRQWLKPTENLPFEV